MAIADVIQFQRTNDPQSSNVVWAPSLNDKSKFIKLFANPTTVNQLIDDHLNAKVGEYCGLVHGNIPNVETNGLIGSKALFRGLKRPRIDLNEDEEVYIYVTNPPCSFNYPSENRFSAEGPTRTMAPCNSVFATYVEFIDPSLEPWKEAINTVGDDCIEGVIHFWEWVLCSEKDNTLPVDYANRYLERLW